MYSPASAHVLNYRITEQSAGFKLTIWELTSTSKSKIQPYLYRINYGVRSIEEAKATLRQHLMINGATGVMNLKLPQEGKVKIMPYPTWNDCEIL